MPYRVSNDDFAELVTDALATLPAEAAAVLEEVPVEVVDRPTAGQERSVGLRQGSLLLGLYVGVSLDRRSVEDNLRLPSTIYLFRRNLEAVCSTAGELAEQVRKTVLHEIGHHFGLDERQLDELGYG